MSILSFKSDITEYDRKQTNKNYIVQLVDQFVDPSSLSATKVEFS